MAITRRLVGHYGATFTNAVSSQTPQFPLPHLVPPRRSCSRRKKEENRSESFFSFFFFQSLFRPPSAARAVRPF